MAALFQLTARRVATPPSITAATLGESPTWDDTHGTLWWIDILGECLYVGHPTNGSATDFDRVAVLSLKGHRVGFVVHTEKKTAKPGAEGSSYHAIWGSQSGLFYSNFTSKLPWHSVGGAAAAPSLDLIVGAPHLRLAEFPEKSFALRGGRVYRFNDGKVGPDGSLWAGGMMERTAEFPKRDTGCGVLMQWTPSTGEAAPFTVGVSAVTVSNGMGWSPAGDVLYHVDTPTGIIHAYCYHKGSGVGPGYVKQSERTVYWALSPERKERGATLDGLCVDNAGGVWVALSGIGEVVRLQAVKSTEGAAAPATITGVVSLPGVSLCTSCCFGGADLTTLFITTARGTSLETAVKCEEADAGFVHAVNVKGIAKGLPAFRLSVPSSVQLPRL